MVLFEDLVHVLEESEEVGDTRTFTECALYQSTNYLLTGNFEKALDLSSRAFASASARGDLQMQLYVAQFLKLLKPL